MQARCSTHLVRVTRQDLIAYPKQLYAGDQHIPAAALVCRVSDARHNASTEHTVVVCMYRTKDEEDIEFWCADKFLEGRMDAADANLRARRAAELLGDGGDASLLAMMNAHAMFTDSGPCSFWRGWRRARTCCGHVACALGALRSRKGDVVEELRQHLTRMGSRPNASPLF
jgi:hypothetical protein